MRMEDLPKDPHKPYEDIMAMLLGTLFVALAACRTFRCTVRY